MNSLLFIMIFIAFSLAEIWIVIRFALMKNQLYLQAVLTMFILLFLYILSDLIFDIGVPKLILLSVMVSIFIQSFLGYYMDLFMRSKVFDRYLHAFGTFSFALFFYSILNIILSPSASPKIFVSIFVFTLGITVGVIFEIIEFVLDKIKHTKMQKNLKDTDFDMIFDIIGSLLAAATAYFFLH